MQTHRARCCHPDVKLSTPLPKASKTLPLWVIALARFFILCSAFSLATLGVQADEHLELGNPSQAELSDPGNYLVEHREYILSYARSRGGPNWVSWHLGRSDLGAFDRTNAWSIESLLPPLWRITHGDTTAGTCARRRIAPTPKRPIGRALSCPTCCPRPADSTKACGSNWKPTAETWCALARSCTSCRLLWLRQPEDQEQDQCPEPLLEGRPHLAGRHQ